MFSYKVLVTRKLATISNVLEIASCFTPNDVNVSHTAASGITHSSGKYKCIL